MKYYIETLLKNLCTIVLLVFLISTQTPAFSQNKTSNNRRASSTFKPVEERFSYQELQQKLKQQQRINVVFALIALLLLIVTFKFLRENRVGIRNEKNLDKRNKALHHQNKQLQSLNKELRQQNEDLEGFASIASHDLKEPIRNISLYSSFLLEDFQHEEEAKDYIQVIHTSANRMIQLLEDLIYYARAGKDMEEPAEINLQEIINSINQNLYLQIKSSNTTIHADNLPTILGHETTITQLFQNLISNAIKFQPKRNPQDPVIHINTIEKGDFHQISIQDNGIGIAEKYMMKIFEPFGRLHSKHKYTGNGIGLATCKKIVERYGGKIWVESQIGRGSTFYFTLPKT